MEYNILQSGINSSSSYEYDVTIVRKYGDTGLARISTLRSVRKKGVLVAPSRSPPADSAGKLKQSLSRSKRLVFEYCLCNDWDYFVTLTFNKDFVQSRFDLDLLHKDFSKFIKAYNRKYNCSIKYVIVPETHEDGAFHFHGVMRGIPFDHLHQFKIGDKMGRKIAQMVKRGEIIFDWINLSSRFGFCSLSPIKNHIACSRYITKYITKAFDNDVPSFGHLYYCSRGLNKSDKIAQGHLNLLGDLPYSFENDYCKILDTDIDTASVIKECIV